ncbi:dihydropteridine reductase [Heyndrickxia shackletonii]|uniref:Flavohemoprotein n=1 Tax=Heyndrickxia shackletonii TaxID=157838 RepID=A0A0Q3TL25_9BACI|nr:NO-inducible flavohemoprotein [Heyndrickxia shackletonii]KQL54337.1 dihydropteridine reductase [Heyndrickxia shackletonii]NEZ01439.1 NO-inducible flavohemoprotein [Heyndrickxia shackletonii]
MVNIQENDNWKSAVKTVKKLDPKKLEIVKSTLPVVKEHGEAITKRFYKRLFENHPELKNIFNMTHQVSGDQPKALANAVYAAAANIEDMSAIMPALERIMQKHRSLNIKPEHYPIVGENLLGAIKEVLGDAATDEIIDAWADAYDVISDVFIRAEQELYKNAESQPGGWAGFKDFVIDKKVNESDIITSFYLKPKDGEQLPVFIPGQYITVKVDIPQEKYTHLRQYSLSDRPGLDYYRISVKREDPIREGLPPGVVSTDLHKLFHEGDILPISSPAGDFYLDINSNEPVVLISGGVGLTPVTSMLNYIAFEQPDRKVYYIQAARNGKVHAFRSHVRNLSSEHPNVKSYFIYEKPTETDRQNQYFDKEGYITLDWLKEVLPSNKAQFYFCGPTVFMKVVNSFLKEWGVPEKDIHYEFFGSFGNLEDE